MKPEASDYGAVWRGGTPKRRIHRRSPTDDFSSLHRRRSLSPPVVSPCGNAIRRASRREYTTLDIPENRAYTNTPSSRNYFADLAIPRAPVRLLLALPFISSGASIALTNRQLFTYINFRYFNDARNSTSIPLVIRSSYCKGEHDERRQL